jgi:hypothetical protein
MIGLHRIYGVRYRESRVFEQTTALQKFYGIALEMFARTCENFVFDGIIVILRVRICDVELLIRSVILFKY